MKRHGITSAAELASRLGITEAPPEPEPEPTTENESDEPQSESDVSGGTGTSRGGSQGNGDGHPGSVDQGYAGNNSGVRGSGQVKRTPGYAGGRPFISYVGTHPDEEGPDPDGLDQAKRMAIEKSAIDLIIGLEPKLQPTPAGNPGFDLFEVDSDGKQIRWVEVKSMTGTLEDRPVGLSRTQFEFAREKGDAYWLYVVEHATDPSRARVLRIQNPAGHAQTFTFDHGWRNIAVTVRPPAPK